MVLLYFTSLEQVVKNSLLAVAAVSEEESKKSPIVVGGIAVQVHCGHEREQLRPTSDLDILYLPQITEYQDFCRGIGGELRRRLLPDGYQVQLKKSRSNFEVKVMNGQGSKARELFFIHFDNLSPPLYARTKAISEREAENALRMPIPGTETEVYVKRMEDILPHKVRRLRKKLREAEEQNPLLEMLCSYAERNEWGQLANLSFKEWLEGITQMQNSFPPTQKVHPPLYSFNKDLYDVCLLARKIEGDPSQFNRAYYLQAKGEIEELTRRQLEFEFSGSSGKK